MSVCYLLQFLAFLNMGVKYSKDQKGVYFKIAKILSKASVKFSEKELKTFLKVLFLYFPNCIEELASSI